MRTSTTVGVLAGLLVLAASTAAQDFAPERGLRHVDPRWHALVGGTLVPEPGATVEDATIVVRDGVIVSVGAGAVPPEGARVWDCTGLTIYAGFVDPFVEVEAPAPEREESGAYWNPMVTPNRSVLDGERTSGELREELRALGFTVAGLAPRDGILRGRTAVVSLGEPANGTDGAAAEVLARDVHQVFAFQRAPFSWSASGPNRAPYPTAEMGAIAVVRQALSDADWYAASHAVYARAPDGNEPPPASAALAALADRDVPLLFDAASELQLLRAGKVAREFDRPMIAVGTGREYRRLPALQREGFAIIVPLDFPDKPKVGTQDEAEGVSLRALQGWEQAPTNPRRLHDAGLTVALTTSKLDKRKDFTERLADAVEHGLPADAALAMITTVPAELLGLGDRLGRVAPGRLANLVVMEGALFDEKAKVRDVWVGGRRYAVAAADAPKADGEWTATFARLGDATDVTGTLTVKDKTIEVELAGFDASTRDVALGAGRVTFLLDAAPAAPEGEEADAAADGDDATTPVLFASAVVEGEVMHGTLMAGDGALTTWSATRSAEGDGAAGDGVDEEGADGAGDDEEGGDDADADDDSDDEPPRVPEGVATPLGAYGLTRPPEQQSVLVTGATIWTAGPDGILEEADLLVAGGEIEYVGPRNDALRARADVVIDGAGKHVTPGIIDCHSHTGVSGSVNEAGARVTSEVRIEDVINPDDINWYRQLAGGLTAANQLHGSANAIGGQNSVVKLRWGCEHPDDMKLQGAMPGIKFALGENPKRVAQNTGVSDEYPQTRMGVATLIRDKLSAGRDDRAAREAYEALPSRERDRTMPPRRDLRLEALGEVVAGERLVHSHSYRQDEILELCRTAQEFGFTIGTFQHVLEGYKVAEVIKEAALGASTFSDWWGYKFEVVDAIPHNATIMTDVGVVTSINSDSSDHARRLNTEAGKAVKYGGLDPHEALKLVTLNPAIQLAVDDRIGSLEEGKDGDFVVWSGPPLSYASRAESTWIDGREYFSLEKDAELRAAAAAERQRLLGKLLAKKKETKKDGDDDAAGGGDEGPESPSARRPNTSGRGHGWRHEDDGSSEVLRGDCGCDEILTEGHR